MKNKYFIFLILLLIVSILGCSKPAITTEVFAQCLTEKGAKMYGTEWCGHCKNQKSMFGEAFQYIDYTDCDKDPDACQTAGVRGYPTWDIKEELYPGTRELSKLAALTECEI
ncbi:hypothetical protein GF358_03835 [Candidatus Woesearchaeota archaeon]|nr:hypothetical protein [Candidatus Woesearchaeota archaeon]